MTKIQILISEDQADQDDIFTGDIHHEWVFVGGRILTLPIYSKWRLVGVLNFVKMLKSPSWMKIFAPNLVGRCIMAMQRYGNKRLIP